MPLPTTAAGVSVVPVFINGTPIPVDETRLFNVRSSATGKDASYLVQGADMHTAQQACESAYQSFLSWKHTTPASRRELLLRVADILERRTEELGRYQVEETSCQESWAKFNVRLGCDAIREIAANITTICAGELPVTSTNVLALVYKEPVGPILAICPWNACVVLASRAIAAPIAAGCSVVFKASELAPRTHFAIVEAFLEAGLPPGVLNQLQVRREDAPAVTEAIISHNAIRKVEFIGSATVGKIIGQLSSKYLKPVLMELGGKAPAVVLKDADLKQAAKLCALGAFLHHGQICMSTERIIVVREVANEFAKYLEEEVQENYAKGAGIAATTAFANHAHLLLNEALDNGATCIAGTHGWLDDRKVSLTPVILGNVTEKHRIFDEESFGPSACLYIVESEDEAVRLANQTAYGLNAAVHSKDIFAALRVARQLEFGQVHIGSITEYDEAHLPIGGVKGSGWGRNNGKYALLEFLAEKTITVHDPQSKLRFGKE